MEEKKINKKIIEEVMNTYDIVMAALDSVLIGQREAKKVIAASLLCSFNSRVLLTGNTGTGKTTLTNFLAGAFNSEKISITSDLLSSEIQTQLMKRPNMDFLWIDEFNRASGKVQSAFIELFENHQISMNGETMNFSDFYVFATQNIVDIAGIFSVPQAVYDRFDVSVDFGKLSEQELRTLLFHSSPTLKKYPLSKMENTKQAVDSFFEGKEAKEKRKDEDLMMQVFNFIDRMEIDGKKLFAGSNIRGHKFLLQLVKLAALANGKNYIESSDVIDFLAPVYKHRVDQNMLFSCENLEEKFLEARQRVKQIKRR